MTECVQNNRRILVIDDNVAIHEDFRKILCQGFDAALLHEARGGLFDDVEAYQAVQKFDVDFADQGQEGHRMVQRAIQQGNPYALAFVDMRMPPGWDGVETIEHLWKEDEHLQIVICTAFSDHDWDQVLERLPKSDKLLILRKPFDNIEVWQLANSLTKRWDQNRQAKSQLDMLAELADQRAEELQKESEQIQLAMTAPTDVPE
ncbi:MAG: response regulator [Nitrospirales bacterium]|nr:response regulator [Nitrospira sp.]MDR4500492.1 response regulator [Nitrospirales bacterium]